MSKIQLNMDYDIAIDHFRLSLRVIAADGTIETAQVIVSADGQGGNAGKLSDLIKKISNRTFTEESST